MRSGKSEFLLTFTNLIKVASVQQTIILECAEPDYDKILVRNPALQSVGQQEWR